jgi:hypothetical protein
LTGDSYNDLRVKLNTIIGDQADISLKEIHELIPGVILGVDGIEEKKGLNSQDLLNILWIIAGVIGFLMLVLLITIISLIRKKAKMAKQKSLSDSIPRPIR